MPSGDEVLIALSADAVLAEHFHERIRRCGADAEHALRADDLRLDRGAVSSGAACKEEGHDVVLHLDQAGHIVAVIPVFVLWELVAAANRPELVRLGSRQPSDQVDVMDGHIDELAA